MIERPAPQLFWSWVVATLVIALPLTGLLLWLLWLFLPSFLPVVSFLWVGFLLSLIGVYWPLRQRSLAFSLDKGQITVTGGVVFRTTRRMRVDAVRQITLWQGPLERRCGIAFLLISATGGHLLVEGIQREQAEEWCQRLAPL